MMMIGEVQTGLLRNLGELSPDDCMEVLGLRRGERARLSLRPLLHAISPELLTGVDCQLPTASGARVRGVGTVAHHAVLVGGRVLQGSSYAHLTRAEQSMRLPWSHYLARPGVIEVYGRPREHDLADGVLAPDPPMDTLNLGAISGRIMTAVQDSSRLDGRTPFRSARTRLRWVLDEAPEGADADDGPSIWLALTGGTLRRLHLSGAPAEHAVAFCEDLALHDWLLTTLQSIIQRALIGTVDRGRVAARLAPAIDHLLHLWMPGVRVDDSFLPFWEELEKKPGFTRQWMSSVERIRDQVAVGTLTLLSVMTESRREADGNPGPRRGVSQNHP